MWLVTATGVKGIVPLVTSSSACHIRPLRARQTATTAARRNLPVQMRTSPTRARRTRSIFTITRTMAVCDGAMTYLDESASSAPHVSRTIPAQSRGRGCLEPGIRVVTTADLDDLCTLLKDCPIHDSGICRVSDSNINASHQRARAMLLSETLLPDPQRRAALRLCMR